MRDALGGRGVIDHVSRIVTWGEGVKRPLSRDVLIFMVRLKL